MRTLFEFSFMCHVVVIVTSDSLDGTKLSNRLKQIRQDIGTNHIQDLYNNLPFPNIIGDGHTLLKNIQTDVESSLTKLTDILKDVQKEILKNEDSFTTSTPLPLCCEISEASLKYDPEFRHNVDFSGACVTKSSISGSSNTYPPATIGAKMKTNYENNRNVLWQHYGTKYGTSILYPSTKWRDCETYDPRFRPEFAATTSPKDKDIVIVIDSSTSMKQPSGVANTNKFVLAKGAARSVIEILNSNDRVAATAFNNEVTKADDCYKDTLSYATKQNIAYLKGYVSLIQQSTSSEKNFEKALTSAFAYFDMESPRNESREKVILFVTDGSYSHGQDPTIVIRDKNSMLQNEVTIFTYVIGPGVSEADQNILKEMSSQVHSNSSYGKIQQGLYKYFDNSNHSSLALEMATFYLHLNEGMDRNQPTYSIPYVDPFSEVGLMTSMCLPADVIAGFNGVACTDIKLSKLLSKVEFFEEGNSSYAFMIERTGRTLVHPLLPDATYIKLSEDPVQVDISILERSQGSADVINKMKRGISGSKHSTAVHFTIPRGTLVNDGSSTKFVNGTYFWGNVANTNFMICIVLGDESHTEISENGFPIQQEDLQNVFMYHERSLTSDSFRNCRFNARLVTLSRTSVKFAPSAFENPFQYTDKAETAEDVTKYTRYFTKSTDDNPGFKASVRPDVWATYAAEKFWKKHESNHLAWRYIGTKSGIMRAFPGVSLTKTYDHEKRPWFRQTISRPDIMYITPPYEDAWGSGILISQEHVIYKKNSKQVTAVLGTDFPLQYFSWYIDQVYPSCSSNEYRCIIIEDSGFIVMHPSFKDSTNAEQFLKAIHITVQEPALAKELTKEGVLNQQECQDLSVNKDLRSFRITLPSGKSNGLAFDDTNGQFELRPIPDTNIFIIRQKAGSSLSADCTCDENVQPDVRKCNCNCLCYINTDYNVCQNIYSTAGSFPCSARLPDTSGVSTPEDLTGLVTCFHPQCSAKRNKTACFSEAECGWCEFTDEGNQIQTPCCRLKEDCSFGKTKSDNRNTCDATTTPAAPTTTKTETQTSDSIGTIIGGVAAAAGAVLALIVVGIIYFIRKNKICYDTDDADPYIQAVPDDRSSGIFDNEVATSSSDSSSNNYTKAPYPVSTEDYKESTFNNFDYANGPK